MRSQLLAAQPTVWAAALALFFTVHTPAHAEDTAARSTGLGEGRLVQEGTPAGDCFDAPLLLNSDSTYENGYAWDYGGVQLPYYGAFAECYSGTGAVCAIVLDLTQTGGQVDQTLDAYVWDDAGGVPGSVITVRTGVDPGAIAFWPSLSRHEVSVSALVDGPTWVGFWGDWPSGLSGWFIGADLDGGDPGCSSTNIVPGAGWPDTGWQNVSVAWGPTHALGIGLRLTDDLPGACCFPDGACVLTNSVLCEGEYLGDGIPCDPNPCEQPPLGACCLLDLTCVVQSEYECNMDEGFYFGDGSICDDVDCFIPCPPLLTQDYDAGQPGRGPNANGILFLHSDPTVVFSQGTDYCGTGLTTCYDAIGRVDTPEPVVFHAIAEFPSVASPRLSGVTFGVNYADCFVLLDAGSCGDFELSSSGWPNSGEGTAVTWTEAETGTATEVYWFAGYVTADQATTFDLAAHPIQGATFADDDIPSNLDPIVDLGTLGFRTDGDVPCFSDAPGACCLPSGDCELFFSEDECDEFGGTWQGDGTTCDPNPCPPPPIGACCFDDGSCRLQNEDSCNADDGNFLGNGTVCEPNPCEVVPTVESSWGKIKNQFRDGDGDGPVR